SYPSLGTSGFPPEQLIPDFGKHLPLQTPVYTQPSVVPTTTYGPGFVTQAPAYNSQAGLPTATVPGTFAQPYEEQRVIALEQAAFGSTYPEHELIDRVDHLESEVLGKKTSDDLTSRLARVEAKLGGPGAFTAVPALVTHAPSAMADLSTQSPPAVPSVHAAYMPLIETNSSQANQQQFSMTQPQGTASTTGITTSSTTLPADFKMVVGSIPYNPASGDYFSQIQRYPGGAVARWTQFPVRLRLPQESPQSWSMTLESGIKKWGQYIPINIASGTQFANIEVSWVNQLPARQLGITRLQPITSGTFQVVIFMLRPTFYPPEIPERTLSGAFMHELGHALGIFGHSDSNNDLMQPTELVFARAKRSEKGVMKIQFADITPRDVNTLKKIYEAPTLPLNFGTRDPLEWSLYSAH
ncbi:MAG: hypothetical protein HY711_05580, partial [Candidatus Melainabacteria bacterium]|nr:hypothetical protein [Candidatus Melainabacteria bacterium]